MGSRVGTLGLLAAEETEPGSRAGLGRRLLVLVQSRVGHVDKQMGAEGELRGAELTLAPNGVTCGGRGGSERKRKEVRKRKRMDPTE